MDRDLHDSGFDTNGRELCPDGACLGVIGADGRCKVCGTPSPDGPPRVVPAASMPADPTPEEAEAMRGPSPSGETRTTPRATEGDAFDPEARELCPDGACLGVIGADGRCRICGTPAA